MTDNTGTKHLNSYKWKPGQSGNPKGRPRGARSQLSEAFLDDLYAKWQERGLEAIDKAIDTNPVSFLTVIAKILPKDVKLDVDLGEQLAAYLRLMNHNDEPKTDEGTPRSVE